MTLEENPFPNALMSIARIKPGVIVLDNKLYVFGGESINPNEGHPELYKSTECYSFELKSWSSCASLPFGVCDLGVN